MQLLHSTLGLCHRIQRQPRDAPNETLMYYHITLIDHTYYTVATLNTRRVHRPANVHITLQVGLEPTTFGLEVQRAIRCATRAVNTRLHYIRIHEE